MTEPFVETLVYHDALDTLIRIESRASSLAAKSHAYNGRAVHLGTQAALVRPLDREAFNTFPGSPKFRSHPLNLQGSR